MTSSILLDIELRGRWLKFSFSNGLCKLTPISSKLKSGYDVKHYKGVSKPASGTTPKGSKKRRKK